MKSLKKILLVNFGGIGDEILFLPVIKSISEEYPEAEITLCLEPRSKSIQSLYPKIDKIIEIDIKSESKYMQLLKFVYKAATGGYDAIISSGSNKMIPLLLYMTGIKTRIGYDCGGISSKLLTKKVKLNKKQYAGRMYHDLVKEYTGKEYADPEIAATKSALTQGMIMIHPGVSKMSINKNIIKSHGSKQWAELIKLLLKRGERVALAGGPDDEECISEILNILKDENKDKLLNLYGKTKNIKELADLIKGSKCIICCDSAPMHIGIATETKTIALFGPTDEKKLVPQRDNITIITTEADCRPCLWDKRQTSCEEKKCLKFNLDKILQAI